MDTYKNVKEKRSSVNFSQILAERVKKSGITIKKLVEMGLNSIEERKNFNEREEIYQKNFNNIWANIHQLRKDLEELKEKNK